MGNNVSSCLNGKLHLLCVLYWGKLYYLPDIYHGNMSLLRCHILTFVHGYVITPSLLRVATSSWRSFMVTTLGHYTVTLATSIWRSFMATTLRHYPVTLATSSWRSFMVTSLHRHSCNVILTFVHGYQVTSLHGHSCDVILTFIHGYVITPSLLQCHLDVRSWLPGYVITLSLLRRHLDVRSWSRHYIVTLATSSWRWFMVILGHDLKVTKRWRHLNVTCLLGSDHQTSCLDGFGP